MKRQQIGTRVDINLTTAVRILAIRQRRQFPAVIEEALIDLLQKYRAIKAWPTRSQQLRDPKPLKSYK